MSGELAYWLSMGLLAVGGLTIACALLVEWIRQRFARRRRCPKCWYDLSHTPAPGLRCSECGYTANHKRKLYKARRRWGVASLGALLLIGSYAAHVTPDVLARGWPAAVPTTVKILVLPMIAPDHDEVYPFVFGRRPPNWTVDDVSDLHWQERLYIELMRDVWTRSLGDDERFRIWHRWASRIAIDPRIPVLPDAEFIWLNDMLKLLAATQWSDGTTVDWDALDLGPAPRIGVRARSVWPRGAMLRMRLDVQSLPDDSGKTIVIRTADGERETRIPADGELLPDPSSGEWSDRTIELWPIDDPARDGNLIVHVEHPRFIRTSRRFGVMPQVKWGELPSNLNLTVVEASHEAVAPVTSDDFAALLLESCAPELELGMLPDPPINRSPYSRSLVLRLDGGRTKELDDFLKHFTFAVNIEIRAGRKLIGRGHFWLSDNYEFLPPRPPPHETGHRYTPAEYLSFMKVPLELDWYWRMTEAYREREWTVTLRACPDFALRDPGATNYWDGEVTLPLRLTGHVENYSEPNSARIYPLE